MIEVGKEVVWKNKGAGREITRKGTVVAMVPAGDDADFLLPDNVKVNHIKYTSSVSAKDRVMVAVPSGNIMHYYCPPESVLLNQGN